MISPDFAAVSQVSRRFRGFRGATMNCRTLGQKYGALEIRVKRFSSPMRRRGRSSGGGTGLGQVTGALTELGVELEACQKAQSVEVRCGGECYWQFVVFVAMCYCDFVCGCGGGKFGCCCVRHWGLSPNLDISA